jgi:hypothetical protein
MQRSVPAGSPRGDVVGYFRSAEIPARSVIERISAAPVTPLTMAVEISAIVVRRPE